MSKNWKFFWMKRREKSDRTANVFNQLKPSTELYAQVYLGILSLFFFNLIVTVCQKHVGHSN